ncbi:MAG: hypothetical protein II008_10105 [Oscillospiraceae bacterium]|nr:hypothetical protein [Oscillospiraceae bacterium]
MAEENRDTGGQASVAQATESRPYELKQVQVRLRLSEAGSIYSSKEITNDVRAAEVMSDVLAQMDREYICVVNLDTKNRPINYNIVSIGDINTAIVPIQNIFKSTILSNSARIMLMHNHPSGDLTPSMQDMNLTKRIYQIGNLMNLPLVDHVIVAGGSGQTYSLLENYPELFRMSEAVTQEIMQGIVQEETAVYGGQRSGKVSSAGKDAPNGTHQYKTKEDRQKEALDDVSKQVEEGIRKVFNNDNYRDYLKVVSRFHTYSFNNTVLIAAQKPDATLCAGFNAWKFKYGRHVKKGEKGIRIISPVKVKETVQEEKTDPNTGQPVFNEDGQLAATPKVVWKQRFRASTVFDIGQTEGNPMSENLQMELRQLTSTQEGFDAFMAGLRDISHRQFRYVELPEGPDSFYDADSREIVIREGMEPGETLKAAVREASQQLLFDREQAGNRTADKTPETRELEAASAAYIICDHFGLDTSDFSFPSLDSWSSGQDLKALRESGNTIRGTASQVIRSVEYQLQDLQKEMTETRENLPEHVSDHENRKENEISAYRIYQIRNDLPDRHERMFQNLATLQLDGKDVISDVYSAVYEGSLDGTESGKSAQQVLDSLFEKFNIAHPDDFRGHSMSVSDVVVLQENGVEKAYYVDSLGFKEVPQFLQQEIKKEHTSNRDESRLDAAPVRSIGNGTSRDVPVKPERRRDSVLAALRQKQAQTQSASNRQEPAQQRDKVNRKERGTAL